MLKKIIVCFTIPSERYAHFLGGPRIVSPSSPVKTHENAAKSPRTPPPVSHSLSELVVFSETRNGSSSSSSSSCDASSSEVAGSDGTPSSKISTK